MIEITHEAVHYFGYFSMGLCLMAGFFWLFDRVATYILSHFLSMNKFADFCMHRKQFREWRKKHGHRQAN